MSIYASFFTALMAAGAYLVIPLGVIPVVLQNLFVMLAGLLLGPRWGAASVGLYLFLGLVGLPVFAGGGAGIGHILGPTGGYLLGYIPAVVLIGAVSRLGRSTPFGDAAALFVGVAVVYACGVPWLMAVTGLDLREAAVAGILPFLPGDGLKAAVALIAARSTRPLLRGVSRGERDV